MFYSLFTNLPNSAPHLTYSLFVVRLFVKKKRATFLLSTFLLTNIISYHFWHPEWTCQLADHHLALSITILIFKRVAHFQASTAFFNFLLRMSHSLMTAIVLLLTTQLLHDSGDDNHQQLKSSFLFTTCRRCLPALFLTTLPICTAASFLRFNGSYGPAGSRHEPDSCYGDGINFI